MKKKNLKKEKNNLYFVVFLFTLSFIIFIFTLYLHFDILEKQEIFIELTIGNKTGFNLDSGKISFGAITPSSNSERVIYLKNIYDFPVKVELSAEGNVSKFLNYQDRYFFEKHETKIVKIVASYSEGAEFGNYSGNLSIVFKRDLS